MNTVIMKTNTSTGEKEVDFNAMLIELVSSGYAGKLEGVIYPRRLCDYDYSKGDIFDSLLTDLMPEDSDDVRPTLFMVNDIKDFIIKDYNYNLTRDKTIAMKIVVLPAINRHAMYKRLYNNISFSLMCYGVTEDKASRIANIILSKRLDIIYINTLSETTLMDMSVELDRGEFKYSIKLSRENGND